MAYMSTFGSDAVGSPRKTHAIGAACMESRKLAPRHARTVEFANILLSTSSLITDPRIVLGFMTADAGIGSLERCRLLRMGNAEGMIAAIIHLHIGCRRHMAVNALCAGGRFFVAVMAVAIVAFRQVALGAKPIIFGFDSTGMGVMAICAGDASLVHFALQERAQNKDLILYLSVGMIQPGIQQAQPVLVMIVGGRVGFANNLPP